MFVSLCLAGGLFSQKAVSGPLPFSEMLLRPGNVTPASLNLWTTWGFGKRENTFNELIARSVSDVWQDQANPLPPVLYKSLMAVESAFNPLAVSPAGAAGLTQLMPDTARRFGLKSSERLDPDKAVPVGIQAFQEKYRVVSEPANYSTIIGLPPEKVPYSLVVADYYAQKGAPQGEERWQLALGAYNGGGGTILRAMAYAIGDGLDPRCWDNLAGAPGKAWNSPLHRACQDVFGPRCATSKVAELAAYPRKIMGLYRSCVATSSGLNGGN